MNASTKKTRNPSKKSLHPKTKVKLVTESNEHKLSGDELIDWMKKFDKQSKQRRKSRDQVLKDLTKNPETFFTLGEPYGYGGEEINIAWSAFRDQPWGNLVSLAEKAEREKLILTPQGKHADILVQRGLAWKFHDTLLFARSRTWLEKQAPSNAVEMVLIHRGHGWQPSLHLEALACIKLGIPDATKAGNASGNEADKMRLNIKKRWALAAALQAHSDAEISSQAHFQMQACEDLLKGFEAATDGSSFLAGVRSALNVGDSGRWVRILADAEMLHDNRTAYVFPHNAKPDREGVRKEIEDAVLAVYTRTQKFPHKDEILEELKPSLPEEGKDDGHIHLCSGDLTHKQFDKRLEGIRKRIGSPWQKGPERPRGRPRKKI
jgi:hypothetical protein